MSRVAVVIVNYNTRDHLRACLATIPAGTHITLVDNGSSDGSVTMVHDEFPTVTVLANEQNDGYGSAANQGVRACSAEYVFVLNSDTLLRPDALDQLAAHLDRHPRVAVAGPRMWNEDGTPQHSCFPFPGTLAWLLENEPMVAVAARIPPIRRRLLCFSAPTVAASVPWVLGAALAIRREAFYEVGGFDDAFFMYYEEVDLCLRLRRAGWDVHHVPQAEVVHLGSASTAHVRAAMAVEHFRSTLRFYRRYYRGPRLAAWLTIMRAKMAFRIVRDSAALALAREASLRVRLREDIAGWRRALWLDR
jgi:N-acetylglucosaminyl-diphospho-decaprenol L-rhamnosyltransferase